MVRRGLVSWVRGRTITSVEVLDPRSLRRHALGPEDFAGNLEGARVLDVVRRGKFLWMPLADTPAAPGNGTAGRRAGPRRRAHGPPGHVRPAAHAGPRRSGRKTPEGQAAAQPRRRHARTAPVRGPAHLRRPVPHLADPHGRRRPWRPRRNAAAAHRRGSLAHRPGPAGSLVLLRRPSTGACGPAKPGSSGRCWTRAWSPGSATSTRTRPSGRRGCTTPGPRTPCAAPTRCGSSTPPARS